MSQPIALQSGDGVIAWVPGLGDMIVVMATDPTQGVVGYCPGALWLATSDSTVWINGGTAQSASWTQLGAGGVTSFNTRTGAVTLTDADVTSAVGQELATTGTPTFAGLTVDAASTTALVVTNSSGNTNVVVADTTNGRLGINTAPASGLLLKATGVTLPNNPSGAGTAGDGVNITGGTGGTSTFVTGIGRGGSGGGMTLQGGTGAAPSGGTSQNRGGGGGGFVIQGGPGAAVTSTGTVAAAGGSGGTLTLQGGGGNTADTSAGSGAAAGGAGSTLLLNGGTGGNATAGSGTSNGGNGSTVQITGGTGGNATNGSTATAGNGGSVFITTGAAGTASGATSNVAGTNGIIRLSQASAIVFEVDTNGNALCGQATLGTTSNNGFPYIPIVAGAPTGTPPSVSGMAPICLDSTNGKLWAYYGGAWHFTVLT